MFCNTPVLTALALSIFVSESPEGQESKAPTLAIMNLVGGPGVTPASLQKLRRRLLAEAQSYSDYRLIASSKVEAFFREPGTADLRSCETESCVLKIARGLSLSRVIFSSVEKVGDYFLLTCRLYGGASGRVMRRWAQQISTDDKSLGPPVKRAVNALLGRSAEPMSAVARHSDPGSRTRISLGPWVSGGVALASTVAGIFLGNRARDELGVSPFHPGYSQAIDGAEEKVLGANVSFGIAGAAALLTGLLLLL